MSFVDATCLLQAMLSHGQSDSMWRLAVNLSSHTKALDEQCLSVLLASFEGAGDSTKELSTLVAMSLAMMLSFLGRFWLSLRRRASSSYEVML